MKRYTLCFVGAFLFIGPAFSEICTDFDDNQNLIEYECGASLQDILESRSKAEAARRAAAAKAQQEAKIAEQKIAAEEKLRQEKIAAEKRAKRGAERAAVRERWRTALAAKWHKFWETHHYAFISVGRETSGFNGVNVNGTLKENGTAAADSGTFIDSGGLSLQFGLMFQRKGSDWKYGLRLDTSSINDSSYLSARIKGRDYYVTGIAAYDAWRGLDLYGGLGVGYAGIKKHYNFGATHTDTDNLFEVKALFGLEYDIVKNFGVFGEFFSRLTNVGFDTGANIGVKVIF